MDLQAVPNRNVLENGMPMMKLLMVMMENRFAAAATAAGRENGWEFPRSTSLTDDFPFEHLAGKIPFAAEGESLIRSVGRRTFLACFSCAFLRSARILAGDKQ